MRGGGLEHLARHIIPPPRQVLTRSQDAMLGESLTACTERILVETENAKQRLKEGRVWADAERLNQLQQRLDNELNGVVDVCNGEFQATASRLKDLDDAMKEGSVSLRND